MLQIESILPLSSNHSFAMVEENFENWHSKRLQIDSILLLLTFILSPWLKKILKIGILKGTQIDSMLLFSDYVRKQFWVLPNQDCI